VLTHDAAIVVGRDEVSAVNLTDGSPAWSVPRLIGPSSAPAIVDGLLVYLEGGGDESASASGSPTTAASPTPSASATSSASPSTNPSVSTLVAIDLPTHRRQWAVPLSDVSRTGVLAVGNTVIVGADDGTVVAVDIATGKKTWTVDVGDHVVAPMASDDQVVLAAVRPESRGAPTLVALTLTDGSEAWRYQPPGSAIDLGAPSISGDVAVVAASDATLLAINMADGSQRWAAGLYTPATGAPSVVTSADVFATDQLGTVYDFDLDSGAERWRFATNRLAASAPIATPTALLQPMTDGSIVALDPSTGHQVWHAVVADGPILGLAAAPSRIIASHTGDAPGFVALATDPAGATEDVTSPTDANPGGLLFWWALAAIPIVVLLVLLGRTLDRRLGLPDLGGADDEDIVDPWEDDEDGEGP
jgi:outer membrane protein assembly factor BamB